MVPCDPQDRPTEGLAPSASGVPSLEKPPGPGVRLWEMTLSADSVGTSILEPDRDHIQFPLSVLVRAPSLEPRCGPYSAGPEQSQAWSGGAGGQGSGPVPPPPWRQAAGLLAAPQLLREAGQPWPLPRRQPPCSPAPPPPTSARTSVLGNMAPSPPQKGCLPGCLLLWERVLKGAELQVPTGLRGLSPRAYPLPSSLPPFTLTSEPGPLGKSGPDLWCSRPAAAPQWGWLPVGSCLPWGHAPVRSRGELVRALCPAVGGYRQSTEGAVSGDP